MSELDRFRQAQGDPDTGFARALAELKSGRKRSHWIWYILPQLAGLGNSPMAEHYGLRGIDEATQYLRDPLLRARLLAVTRVLADQLGSRPHPALTALMGSRIDALKTVSSLTLFRALAARLDTAEPHADYAALAQLADSVLRAAAAQGMPACGFTQAQLEFLPPASPPETRA